MPQTLAPMLRVLPLLALSLHLMSLNPWLSPQACAALGPRKGTDISLSDQLPDSIAQPTAECSSVANHAQQSASRHVQAPRAYLWMQRLQCALKRCRLLLLLLLPLLLLLLGRSRCRCSRCCHRRCLLWLSACPRHRCAMCWWRVDRRAVRQCPLEHLHLCCVCWQVRHLLC